MFIRERIDCDYHFVRGNIFYFEQRLEVLYANKVTGLIGSDEYEEDRHTLYRYLCELEEIAAEYDIADGDWSKDGF